MTELRAIFSLQRKWLHCLLPSLLSKISNSVFPWLIGVGRGCTMPLKISTPQHCLLEFGSSWSELEPSNLHLTQSPVLMVLCTLNLENHWYRGCIKEHGSQYPKTRTQSTKSSMELGHFFYYCQVMLNFRRRTATKNSVNSFIQGTYSKGKWN